MINKWIILLLACLLLNGNYYCYDIPASIASSLQQYLQYNQSDWLYLLNLLYSIYSIPNLILPIFSGILIDKLGTNKTLIVFSLVVTLGQLLFTIGTNYKISNLMLLARGVFGVGGEALEVAQAVIVTEWFPNNAGLVLGITLTAARLSTAANDNISPYVYSMFNHPNGPNIAGLAVTILSLICAIIIVLINRYNTIETRSDDTEKQSLLTEHRSDISTDGYTSDHEVDDDSTAGNLNSNLVSPTNSLKEFNTESWLQGVKSFDKAFWALCMTCILCYATVNPYIHILQGYLEEKYYPGQPIMSARVMSIPDIISAIGSPLVGFLLDKYGFRSVILPFSSLVILLSHLLIMNTTQDSSPIPVMALLGVAYSLFSSSLWPCVPGLVNKSHRATAYGLLTVAMNIALTVTPVLISWINDIGGYNLMEYGFCVGSILAAMSGITVFIMDFTNKKVLYNRAIPNE